ncbi:hypothetical protein ACFGVS_00065 [Mucilaginibacter sp. AW1-7]|uniref:hypothetical protein n=1 Tax=Mucilaginibacter sp. AW1-7 TaxID=3349874 RepID=UPI003F733FDD
MPQRPCPALKGQHPPAMRIAHRLKYTSQIAIKGRHISRSGKGEECKYSSAQYYDTGKEESVFCDVITGNEFVGGQRQQSAGRIPTSAKRWAT